MDPGLIGTVTPTLANTVEERFIGRLTPGSNRFNGSFQAATGSPTSFRTGTPSGCRRASARVYDLTGQGETILAAASGSSTTGRRATWSST
jgi:hypothetical protein